jgi:hypothetical protein
MTKDVSRSARLTQTGREEAGRAQGVLAAEVIAGRRDLDPAFRDDVRTEARAKPSAAKGALGGV